MVHRIEYTQFLPIDIETCWQFISTPLNLQQITPEYMRFQIFDAESLGAMYPGLMIRYRVRPVLGIPLHWCTEITHVERGVYFVDEQRIGPYRLWHHEHHVKEADGGVLMTDIVHYALPFGFIGEWAHRLFVRKQLKSIFEYRKARLDILFPKA